jgi:hypothetical protein
MTEIRNVFPQRDEPVTDAAKFLAIRGHILIKQFHRLGKRKCDKDVMLTFSTLIFTKLHGTKVERTFGLKVESENSTDNDEFCFLDFEELKELLLAIKNLIGLAKQTSTVSDEYTECEYVTKGCFKVGFCQDPKGQQQAFINISEKSSTTFMSFDDLRMVFELVKSGREYLIEKGAEEASPKRS